VRKFGAGGFIRFIPEWLPREEADALLAWLLASAEWDHAVLQLFGREVHEPRLSTWFADRAYTYSGRTLSERAWPEPVAALRRRIEKAAREPFNSVLVNRYRSGRDSMGFHADAEPELGRNPVVASLSLGAARRFIVQPKAKSRAREAASYVLEHGSLLIMGGDLQHHYRHAVPKTSKAVGERVNLTFRQVGPKP
jgi:alkylated DNA repair dioxygenase AlkB